MYCRRLVLSKMVFFCFWANFLGEILNLRSCDVVVRTRIPTCCPDRYSRKAPVSYQDYNMFAAQDMWDWTVCGSPHDIALDLFGTSSMVRAHR